MNETGDLRLGSGKTDNLSLRGRERRKEKGEQAGGRRGNKQRSDLELDNSKFGVDSSIRYGCCQVLVCSMGAVWGERTLCFLRIRKLLRNKMG